MKSWGQTCALPGVTKALGPCLPLEKVMPLEKDMPMSARAADTHLSA